MVDLQTFLDDIAEYISETDETRIKITVQARGFRECSFMTVGFQGFLYDLLDDCRRHGILVYLRIVWDFGGFNSSFYRIRVLNFIISRYIEL